MKGMAAPAEKLECYLKHFSPQASGLLKGTSFQIESSATCLCDSSDVWIWTSLLLNKLELIYGAAPPHLGLAVKDTLWIDDHSLVLAVSNSRVIKYKDIMVLSVMFEVHRA